MAEGRLRKIALKWMPKPKRARGRPKKNWMERIRKAMNERNLNESQWEDRKQWSLGVGQRRTMFWNRHTYILLRQAASGFSSAAVCLATLCSSVVVRFAAESHSRGFCIERFYVLVGWSISDRPSPVVPSYILLLHHLLPWNHHSPLYFSTTRFLPLNVGQNLVSAGVLMIPRDFILPSLDQHLLRLI